MSNRSPCADCDPSTASTASVSSDLHKYHVACSCGNNSAPPNAGQYAECAPTGPGDSSTQKSERPPALPPRPPPRPRTNGSTIRNGENNRTTQNNNTGPRKYVWWCMGMGITSCSLGGLLLAAAFILRALTTSLHYLETIPTPIPATMLVFTGLCVISLAWRRNRYSYLIKVVGACCLVCALTCVLVTITTTVIHMNRLQVLRQCFYSDVTKTCVCSSMLIENNIADEEGVKCIFEDVSDCGVVHGSLYRCLSAIFGISVAGVLVCICSAMLAYQLLSHERKKMYWEQLELRCRSLYRPNNNNQQNRVHNQQPQVCGECCTQCRAAAVANWDLQQRFWASGRVGNLYSPNPGTGRRVSPWSWFPWSRNSNQRVGGSSSGDSAYGFGNTPSGYWQLGPPPPYTPHHRYLHYHGTSNSHHHMHHSHSPIHMPHTCPMMTPSNRSGFPNSLTPHGSISDLETQHLGSSTHHHHHQGSLRMGMNMCHQNNQVHSSIRVLPCLDPAILTPGHFVPINDNDIQSDDSIIHHVECHHQSNTNSNDFAEKNEDTHQTQHACQQHQENETAQSSNVQGEENLGFQCEKQSPPQQGRGGESELYFADVSSCCNVSLKTVEYCAGLVGTIETQADTSSGDSDVGSGPPFKGRPPRPRPNNSNLQNTNSPSPRLNNARWKKQNSPMINISPSKNKRKSPSVSSKNDVRNTSTMHTRMSPIASVSSLQGRSSNHYQEQSCFNCSDSSCKESNKSLEENQMISGRKISRDISEDSVNSSVLSNMNIVINQIEICQDNMNHIEGPNRSSIRIKSSPNRSSTHRTVINQCGDVNDIGLPQVNHKRIIDDSLVIINNDLNSSHNKKQIEESNNIDHSMSFSQSRRKPLEDSLIDPNVSSSPLRWRNMDDSNIDNELNSSLLPLRRKCLEESMSSSDMNSSISQSSHKSLEDSSCLSLNQRGIEDINRKEDNHKTSSRRKPIDDSMLSSDSNSSSSPFRRMCMEDSPINDLDISINQMKSQLEESYINNPNIRRKNTENSFLNTPDHCIRRTLCEDSLNKDVNLPLRRKSIEDALSNTSHSAVKRKPIDESMLINRELNNSLNPMRRKVLEDFIVDDPSIRRKCIDEAMLLLNDQNDSALLPLRRKILEENMFNNQSDVNVPKLNFVHMMQHNARFSNEMMETSLVTESEGSRRGIIGGVCIAPDLRYEPVQGFENDIQVCGNNVGPAPMHMRCYSDSNTMDSGWQSGSEKHATD